MHDKIPQRESPVSRLIGSAAILAAHFFTVVLLLLVFVKVVPLYTEFFEQSEVQLPAATQLVIRTSWTVVMYWYLIIPLGMVVDGAIVLLLSRFSSKGSWLLSLYSHMWLLAVIVLLFAASVTLVMPLVSLVQVH